MVVVVDDVMVGLGCNMNQEVERVKWEVHNDNRYE